MEGPGECHRVQEFSVSVFYTRAELVLLANEWNPLLRNSAADTIFLTWEWINSWLDLVSPDASLFVVAVFDSQRNLVAIAPLYLSLFFLVEHLPYRCLRVLGDNHSGAEYPDIIVRYGLEEKVLPVIARTLARCSDKWDWIWLPNIAGWTAALDRWIMVLQPSVFFLRKRRYSFSAVTLPASWPQFCDNLPPGRYSILRRQERKLTRTSKIVTLRRCVSTEEVRPFLDMLFKLHAKRWQSAGQQGSFARRPRMEKFYRDFAVKALSKGWLGFFALDLDGAMRALQYGYTYNKTYYQIQEGFDPVGPSGMGNVLRAAVIRWCMEQKLHEYDFLGDHTEHKAAWDAKERFGWQLFGGSFKMKNFPLKMFKIWPSGRWARSSEG